MAETFELSGPKNYSTAEIAVLVDREIIKHRRHINLPKRIMKPAAYWLNRLIWWPTTCADEVEREFIDQKIDPAAKTFKDLGIEPAELSNLTFHYLVCTFYPVLTSLDIGSLLSSTERLQKFPIHRPSPSYRTRERRRQEICPCAG